MKDVKLVGSAYAGFSGFTNLIEIVFDNVDTSQVTDMRYMFAGCKNLYELDLSRFNTSQVTNMRYMFEGCKKLYELDLSSFNTSQVTDMGYMFFGCENLVSLDLSNFNTSQVTDMSGMFYWCLWLNSLDLSNFDTSKVTDMDMMFNSCNRLSSLDISNFDTSQVKNKCMTYMLNGGELAILYTPKHMGDTEIVVFATLLDEQGVEYTRLNEENCKKVLINPKKYNLSTDGIYLMSADSNGFVAGLTTSVSLQVELDNVSQVELEYRWTAYRTEDQKTIVVQDWTSDDCWLNWKPEEYGEYTLTAEARIKAAPSKCVSAQTEAVRYTPYIKGKCQMPYTGEGGGYLIGIETYDNPNQSYTYEMLILDCTLLAEGKDAWIYTTGRCGVAEGNALWTVWQPQYGYYWTLFRVYDANGVMIDQDCYGFVNAY